MEEYRHNSKLAPDFVSKNLKKYGQDRFQIFVLTLGWHDSKDRAIYTIYTLSWLVLYIVLGK